MMMLDDDNNDNNPECFDDNGDAELKRVSK